MAKIEPFRSIHYNPQVIEDISRVLCPPYDVIDLRGQETCYQKHPYNIIRLILGKDLPSDSADDNKYRRAAGYIEEWLRRGVLVQDETPAVYFYEQIFSCPGNEGVAGGPETGKKFRRFGFIALMRLDEEGGEKSVYPHEHTHTAPKEDRLRLIKSVEANLSPIFTIFSDTANTVKGIFEQKVKKQTPLFNALDPEDIENRIWKVSDPALIQKLRKFLEKKEVFIADGHHRHEVAKTFRDAKRSLGPQHFRDSYNYIMTYFTPLEDDGLYILPTHRLLKNARFVPEDLSACFAVRPMASCEELIGAMKAGQGEPGVFGLYKDAQFHLLKISDKRQCNRLIQEGAKDYKNLDVVILQKVIFEHLLKIQLPQIHYQVRLSDAVHSVDEGAFDALFILNPTRVSQIRSIALAGEVMPQKSTYFYPKLLSGFLIYKF